MRAGKHLSRKRVLMSFAELISTAPPARSATCSVAIWLEAQNPADRGAALDALATPAVTAADIFRAMRTMGYTATQGAVQRHRRGDCKCPSQTN